MSQKGGLEYNLQENNALFYVVSLIFRTMFSVYKVFGKYHLNEEVAEVICFWTTSRYHTSRWQQQIKI